MARIAVPLTDEIPIDIAYSADVDRRGDVMTLRSWEPEQSLRMAAYRRAANPISVLGQWAE